MPLVTGKTFIRGSLTGQLQKTVTGFGTLELAARASFGFAQDAAVYTAVLLYQGTLAHTASPITTIDMRSFTDALGDAVTGTGIAGLCIKATGNGGKITIAKGASNGLVWFFGSASDTITLNCGTNGCGITLADGTPFTVDATHRNIDLSNTGSADCTITVGALIKTT